MSNSVIGALRVNLGLDSAQFEKGAKRSQNTLKTMRNQFAAVATAAAAMGAALSTAALKGARAIDDTAKAARRIDASVAGYRALEMAADDAGVGLSSLADGIQTMNREIAKNSKGAQEALSKLGVTASDLGSLDADEKIALISDRVKALGLDSGQASVLLQQLGIRNREMALLVLGGGDALRQARIDVQQYGLALSDVDAAKIEAANDAIAGLADITTYIGDQLALKFVPAMGAMADAMTNSLREGGLLRGVIDGLIGNLERMTAYVGVIVAGFGTRYVAALVAAKVATMTLTGALALLRTALIRTGIGAVIVAVGELVLWLARAREATGSFGNAFKKIALQVKAGAMQMQAFFIQAINKMLGGFIEFTEAVAAGLNGLFGTNLSGGAKGLSLITQDLGLAYNEARDGAAAATSAANALNVTLKDTDKVAGNTADSLDKIEGAAGGAGKGMDKAKDDAKDLADEMDGPLKTAVDGVTDAFGDFVVRGFKDFKSFTQGILNSFKQMLSQMIATAARNKIMLAFGGGGSIAGTAASAAGGVGNILGGAGSIAGGLLGIGGGGGALGGLGAGLGGILSGGGLGASFANLGGLLSGSVSGLGAIGAALPALGVIAAPLVLLAAFKKKKTLLDSGLDVNVDGSSVDAQSFQTINTKRFFGLSSKTRTSRTAADPAIAQAVNDMQVGVQQMAKTLGVGAEAFEGFSYKFNLSLKDLSADEAAAKVAEEIAKMGDAFAGLIPHISNVNDLVAVLQERFGLETRLLQLQGNVVELRRRELDSVSHYNRAILQQIFDLEDAQAAAQEAAQEAARAAQEAAQAQSNAIQRTIDLFRAPLALDSTRFNDRFTASISAAEDRRLEVQNEADNAQLTELKLMRIALEELRREQRDMRLYGSAA